MRHPQSLILIPIVGAQENPFESSSHLDSNPFDNPSGKNPFQHPNDSAFSLDSQDTARGLGGAESVQSGYGYGAETSSATRAGGGGGRGGFSGGNAGTSAREADLRRREEDIRRREEALGMKENNWPPRTLRVAYCLPTVPAPSVESSPEMSLTPKKRER